MKIFKRLCIVLSVIQLLSGIAASLYFRSESKSSSEAVSSFYSYLIEIRTRVERETDRRERRELLEQLAQLQRNFEASVRNRQNADDRLAISLYVTALSPVWIALFYPITIYVLLGKFPSLKRRSEADSF